jgi:hypothetical protein
MVCLLLRCRYCVQIPCREARVDELSAVHDLALIREVAAASKLQQEEAAAAGAAAHSQQQQQQQQSPRSPQPHASPPAGEQGASTHGACFIEQVHGRDDVAAPGSGSPAG